MMNIAALWVMWFLGCLFGMVISLGLCSIDNSNFVRKEKVDTRKTIIYKGQYVQYSAVRRMVVPSTDSVFTGK